MGRFWQPDTGPLFLRDANFAAAAQDPGRRFAQGAQQLREAGERLFGRTRRECQENETETLKPRGEAETQTAPPVGPQFGPSGRASRVTKAMASNSQPPVSPLLVRVSDAGLALKPRKLEKYFQSLRESNGGECSVHKADHLGPGAFLVEFLDPAAKERVLKKENHHITVDGKEVTISLEPTENPLEKNTRPRKPSLTQPVAGVRVAAEGPNEDLTPSAEDYCLQKFQIFLDVKADLNCDLLSKEQRECINNLYPHVKKVEGHNGIETVHGDFRDIEKIHRFLSEQLLAGGQKPASFTLTGGSRSQHQLDWRCRTSPYGAKTKSEEKSDHCEVPLFYFEYFKHNSPNKIESIEKKFDVKIKIQKNPPSTVSLHFTSSQSDGLEAAVKSFVSEFQKVVETVKEEQVKLKDNKPASEAKQELSLRFKNLLIKEKERELTLVGTESDISAAKHFLACHDSDSFAKIPVQILPPGYMTKGIELDVTLNRLLKSELCQELAKIEKDFDVQHCILDSGQKTCVRFEPKNKELDLSLHAYSSFIDAIQYFSSQLRKDILKQEFLGQKIKHLRGTKFEKEFTANHPQIHFALSQDSLTLTGLPNLLAKAKQWLLQRRMSPSTGQKRNEDHEVPMDIDSNDSPKSQISASSGATGVDEDKDKCAICMDKMSNKKVLSKCKHEFCTPCIEKALSYRPFCPMCQTAYGVQKGNQPDGHMSVSLLDFSLPGYKSCNTIEIKYDMLGGIQTKEHPNPGKQYSGVQRTAYLPNNSEGKEVLSLLRRAFDQKLIFTVGYSRTTGMSDVITWNDIHHKTCMHGGPERYGYPDPAYLKRVKEELKAKGIE